MNGCDFSAGIPDHKIAKIETLAQCILENFIVAPILALPPEGYCPLRQAGQVRALDDLDAARGLLGTRGTTLWFE